MLMSVLFLSVISSTLQDAFSGGQRRGSSNATTPQAMSSISQAEHQRVLDELAARNGELSTIKQQLTVSIAEKEHVERQLQERNVELAELNRQVQILRQQLAERDTERTQQQIATLRTEMDQVKLDLARRNGVS